jgi:uncharacterized protein (TIGR03032 family)
VQQGGVLSVNQIGFTRAMGLWASGQRIYLAALAQVWRLENMLRPGECANQHFDRCYVPRNAQTTGDIDVHELAVQPNGRVIFVSTAYSCLAEFDQVHSFRPIWTPPFITKLRRRTAAISTALPCRTASRAMSPRCAAATW